MKRLSVFMLAVLGFGTATFAGSPVSSSKCVYTLNDESTLNGIANFLKTDAEQKETLKYVFSEGERRMERATAKGATEEEASTKAIFFNLGNARAILSEAQYKKIVSIVNLTIYNEKERELFAEK